LEDIWPKIFFQILQEGFEYGDRLLPSGYFESQAWGALQRCWVGFVIAKGKMEWDKIDPICKTNPKPRERIRN
jgi:hypothetical protein